MAGVGATLRSQTDLVLVLAVTAILFILFVPIPPGLLDVLLITNFSLAFLILLLTFYVQKPLEFSTFPSLLLIATLFRLALNIAATRLILSEAYAGRVIEAIGAQVVGGNYVIGLIVFIVLIVVQYVVVTNGAQRVAEVAARFTLDSMPGKQMSIDADMNIGLIDEHEARRRRALIEKEGNFYGAMDGASKFVKGDAIAGIIIVLINIVGGLAIGIAQRGMGWSEALQTFTLLTVGDGIVTQIPALIISTGTGIIVTRAASDSQLSTEISRQITAYPKILGLVAVGLLAAVAIPGIPALPVLALFVVVVALERYARRAGRAAAGATEEKKRQEDVAEDLYGLMAVDAIELRVGQSLVPLVGADDSLLMERIRAFRKLFALETGLVIPKVRVKDDKKLAAHAYRILVFGAKLGEGEVLSDRVLAIDPGDVKEPIEGLATKDPTYGLPARWIVERDRERARAAGYTVVEALSVLMTHLGEVIRQHAANLLTRAESERLVAGVKSRQAGLVEELIPNVLSISDVQKVLQGLLREKVPIRNLEQILEALVDRGKETKDPEVLTEVVRQKLAPAICDALLSSEGELCVLVLDPAVERTLSAGVQPEKKQRGLFLDPKFAERLIAQMASHVQRMMSGGLMPVLLCPPGLRRHVRALVERVVPQLAVLSMDEVPSTVSVRSYAMVDV